MKKLKHLQTHLKQQLLDGCFIQNPQTIAYLTGFSSNPHERLMLLVVPSDQQPTLVLPELDVEMAKKVTTLPLLPHKDSENPYQLLPEIISATPKSSYAVEKNYMNLLTCENIQSIFPNMTLSYDIAPFIDTMRLIKSSDEIDLLMTAGADADRAIKLAAYTIMQEMTEEEAVSFIEYGLKKQGVSRMSFDTMVLSQQNAANPHGVPEANKLLKNQLALVDLGTMYKGYASDITRTMLNGTTASYEQESIFNIVLEAHHLAIENAKVGMRAGELDAIARDYITKHGYGHYFTHRLGHGIGQSVHEFPSIASGNDFVLQAGMCFSIEPGIYIPGKLGIRIEDCLVLKSDGVQLLTHSPYSLKVADYL